MLLRLTLIKHGLNFLNLSCKPPNVFIP